MELIPRECKCCGSPFKTVKPWDWCSRMCFRFHRGYTAELKAPGAPKSLKAPRSFIPPAKTTLGSELIGECEEEL